MLAASDMRGKFAVVTGSCGDLGKATALTLARSGAGIFLVDTDLAGLERSATEVRELGVEAHVYATDVAEAKNCRAAVEAAVKTCGRLDALCNVANVFCPGSAADMAENDWHATMAVNLSAPFFLIQAALPHLIKAEGAVVSVASCGAFMAPPFTAAYTASKAGLVQMNKVLAKELLETPVRINCLAPGSMAIGSGGKTKIAANVDMSRVQKLSPSRGMISVEEVAAVIAFLASDASAGFHGACITMDNGLSLG